MYGTVLLRARFRTFHGPERRGGGRVRCAAVRALRAIGLAVGLLAALAAGAGSVLAWATAGGVTLLNGFDTDGRGTIVLALLVGLFSILSGRAGARRTGPKLLLLLTAVALLIWSAIDSSNLS